MTPTRFLVTVLRVWAAIPRHTSHTVSQISEACGMKDLAVRRALQALESAALVHGDMSVRDTGGPAPVPVMVFCRGLPDDDSYGGDLGHLPMGADCVAWLFERLQHGVAQADLVNRHGFGVALARSVITTGRKLGIICIKRWERTASCDRGHRAVYAFGTIDAPKPPRVEKAVYESRCRARKKLRKQGAGYSAFSAHAFSGLGIGGVA